MRTRRPPYWEPSLDSLKLLFTFVLLLIAIAVGLLIQFRLGQPKAGVVVITPHATPVSPTLVTPQPVPFPPGPLAPEALARPVVVAPVITEPAEGAVLPSDQPVTFAGTAPAGAILRLVDNGKAVGDTLATDDGRWRIRMTEPLSRGAHQAVAQVVDENGNLLAASSPIRFTVVSVSVTVSPSPTGIPLAITYPRAGDHIRPTVSFAGTASSNARVRVYDNDLVLGETTADAKGIWTLTPLAPLLPGIRTLWVAALDETGKEIAVSPQVQVTVLLAPVASGTPEETPAALAERVSPTATPVPPTVAGLVPETSLVSRMPVLMGTTLPDVLVRIYDGAQVLGEVMADAEGLWRFVPHAPLAIGRHVFRFALLNADGQEVAITHPIAVVVPEGAPLISPPVILWPPSDAQLDTPHPKLFGTSPPGEQVRIYDGNVVIGQVLAGLDGRWALQSPKPLVAGRHTLVAAVVDAAGHRLITSKPVTVTIVAAGLRTVPSGTENPPSEATKQPSAPPYLPVTGE